MLAVPGFLLGAAGFVIGRHDAGQSVGGREQLPTTRVGSQPSWSQNRMGVARSFLTQRCVVRAVGVLAHFGGSLHFNALRIEMQPTILSQPDLKS